jgi:phosphate transport system substrate-binding protein
VSDAQASSDRASGSLSLLIYVLLLALLVAACSQSPGVTPVPVLIQVSGATSMQPLLRELAAAYSERHSNVSFSFASVGSTAGIEMLQRGLAGLALVSRELLPEEEHDLQTGERLLSYSAIAHDAIAVVVNESNPLRELTLYQVRNIFDGRVDTWEELGSPVGDIVVVSREDGSGTRAVFEESVMYGRRMASTAVVMPGSEAIRDYVSTHAGAIGYLSMGYLDVGVTAVAVEGIMPQRQTVEDGSYWITRPFLLVSEPEPDAEVAAFMQFARSPAGQAIVRRTHASSSPGR